MKKSYVFVTFFLLAVNLYSQVWVEQTQPPPPHPLKSVSIVNSRVAWACGDSGTVLYTSNSGSSWQFIGGGVIGNNNIYCIAALDSLSAVCAVNTSFAIILKTTDKGFSWQPAFIQPNGFINDIEMITPLMGFAYGNPVGGRWTLMRTANGGQTFDTTGLYLPQSGSETGNLNAMYINGSNVLFGTNNFRIYRSTNGGTNWNFSPIGGQNIHSITFNGALGFAAGDLCYTSTNNGINWTQVNGLPGSGVFKTISNNNQYFWYGRGTQIFYSSNNGANFVLQYTSPVAGVYQQLSFVLSANDNILTTIRGWGITNNGAISYYTDTEVGLEPISVALPSSFKLYQNYPNPFNPSTRIKFDMPPTAAAGNLQVKMTIFNILGCEIVRLIDGKLTGGKYEIDFNASSLPGGIYFCKLEAADFTDVKKLILLK
jgi:hypothetical protein